MTSLRNLLGAEMEGRGKRNPEGLRGEEGRCGVEKRLFKRGFSKGRERRDIGMENYISQTS